MHNHRSFRLSIRSQALLLLLGSLGCGANAAIITLGQVNPDPISGVVVGRLSLGLDGSGSVTVNGGSSLSADVIGLGEQATGNGSLTVTGAGSRVSLLASGTVGNLDIGSRGVGRVSVLNGASFAYGAAGVDCSVDCRIFVGNAAGSNGSLLVSGAGSRLDTTGRVVVGQASVFTLATDGIDYGTPGASTSGAVRVDGGATATSSALRVGQSGGGSGRLGTEQASGSLIIDGLGSAWNLVRQGAQVGAQALLGLGTGGNTTGTVTVQNGGRLGVDGASSRNDVTGINVGSGGATSVGRMAVDGPGSQISFSNAVGFINVGVNAAGSNGQLDIRNGGQVSSADDSLNFVSVGRDGGSGAVNVSGTGSLLRLSGINPVDGGGAFLQIGRNTGTGASQGTVNITAGGRVEVDVRSSNLPGPNLAGFQVGIGAGSNGALNISGAGSTLQVQGGAQGLAPYAGVGRDGATGLVNISNGGQLLMDSARTSTGAVNTSGNSLIFDIGRNNTATPGLASTGQVNVSGAGSLLAMTGASVDRFIQVGRGDGGNGTLNVSNGGRVQSLGVLVGTDVGAIGTLNLNAGRLDISGTFNSGLTAGQGGGMSVGRNGGLGTASFVNGSVVNIESSSPRAGLIAGGSSTTVGGTGTVHISGGSVVNISGPQAYVAAGYNGSTTTAGVGIINLAGGGSALNVTGTDATVFVGRDTNTSGLINVGAGASLNTNGLVGIAHNGTSNTGGTGVLVVDGTVNAATLVNGSAGLIGGNGVVNANTTNHGVINPGHSPGKLTFNGSFDNSDGKIVLEVKVLPDGSFITDQIVFGNPAQVTMGAGQIEFDFLGDTDPNAFFRTGLFQLDTFFKEVDANGNVVDLPDGDLAWFASTGFDAMSDTFHFSSFSFDPFTGAKFSTAASVPLPGSAALALAGLLALWRTNRRTGRRTRLDQ